MSDKENQIRRWLNFAKEDLKAAQIAIKENLPNIVCFHSQQTAEKILKALFLAYFDTVPKTHDLEVILEKIKTKTPKLSEFKKEIRFLNRFYIPTRYPDTLPGSLPEGLPTKKDAKEAITYAQRILDVSKSYLSVFKSTG